MIKRLLLALLLGISPALYPLALQAQEPASVQTQTVNINSADAETLASNLVGIGHRKAVAIVQYRDDFGPFFSVEDLLEVKGVGPSIVDKNRTRITLE